MHGKINKSRSLGSVMVWQQWQALADNPSYWHNHHERGLLKAEYLRDYGVQLWFGEALDVSIYELDFYPLLFEEDPGEVLHRLRDLEYFKTVQGHYSLNWFDPQANPEWGLAGEPTIDLAPECVRYFCPTAGTLLKDPHNIMGNFAEDPHPQFLSQTGSGI